MILDKSSSFYSFMLQAAISNLDSSILWSKMYVARAASSRYQKLFFGIGFSAVVKKNTLSVERPLRSV